MKEVKLTCNPTNRTEIHLQVFCCFFFSKLRTCSLKLFSWVNCPCRRALGGWAALPARTLRAVRPVRSPRPYRGCLVSVQRAPRHPPHLPCPARACPWTAITIRTRRAGMTGAGNATVTTAGRCARSSPARCPPAAAPPSARDSAARRAQVKAGCRPVSSLRGGFCPAGLITSGLGVEVGVRVGGDAGHRARPGTRVSAPWFWSTTDTESAGAVTARPKTRETLIFERLTQLYWSLNYICVKACGPMYFFNPSSPFYGAWIKAEVLVNWKRLVLIVFHKSLLFTKVILEVERIIQVHSYCSFLK